MRTVRRTFRLTETPRKVSVYSVQGRSDGPRNGPAVTGGRSALGRRTVWYPRTVRLGGGGWPACLQTAPDAQEQQGRTAKIRIDLTTHAMD